jgi:hypothetical protein
MISRAEFATAIAGVRGLVRFDARAFGFFDATLAGFWRSYWAAAILAPFTAAMVARQAMADPPDSPLRFVISQAAGYAMGWLAFPLVMVQIADMLGRRDRYFAYMVSYNWFHLVEIALWGPLLVLGLTGAVPPEAEGLLSLIILAVLLGYEWFIAKTALKVEGGTAAALVAIDLLLNLVIDRVADALS